MVEQIHSDNFSVLDRSLNDLTDGITDGQPVEFIERTVARLLIVLYHSGYKVASLLDGDTRRTDSPEMLFRFDFWVREPGHLALALLHAFHTTPQRFAETQDEFRADLNRIMENDAADIRRIPGKSYNMGYRLFADLEYPLAFLIARGLVSDRPSFTRGGAHQIILEAAGIAAVERILAECPSFAWYKDQCELVSAYSAVLDSYDLNTMPYLAPDLSPFTANTFVPVIRRRYAATFGV
jgi:hypothetical protein